MSDLTSDLPTTSTRLGRAVDGLAVAWPQPAPP